MEGPPNWHAALAKSLGPHTFPASWLFLPICWQQFESSSLDRHGLDGRSTGDSLWSADMCDIVCGVAVRCAGVVVPVQIARVIMRPRLSNDRPIVLHIAPDRL